MKISPALVIDSANCNHYNLPVGVVVVVDDVVVVGGLVVVVTIS